MANEANDHKILKRILLHRAVVSISLWSQLNQNELLLNKLYPNSLKCDLAVGDIYEDLTENIDTK